MIGKIVKGRGFKGCISYILEKDKAKLLASEGVLEMGTKSIINSFYMQSLLNPKLSKCVGHIPLAFSPEDAPRMTDQFMEGLAKEYVKAMKIENTQYIIVRHDNTSHPHCHIVFNRVNNNGKTISDKNDHFRNEKVCKKLKDKYNLTYGNGKENTNIQKLNGSEKIKHEIYKAIGVSLSLAKNWQQLERMLKLQGVSVDYKYRGQTKEVQGISFKKRECSFKGSEIDRKFSYSKLNSLLTENISAQSQSQEQPSSPQKKTTTSENVVSSLADIASGIGGLLNIQPSEYDVTEADYQQQQAEEQRKKKRKRRGFGL